nr:NADH dehydrogenase subunit 2 [Tachinomorphus sp. 1 FYJ-2024a]
MFNNYKFLFLFTLIYGLILTCSSNSWMIIWMGLEINLLSFIPLINNSLNSMSTEASMKYFITQAISSTIILFYIIMLLKFNSISNIMINSAILTKMGAAPFHFWMPEVIEGLNWMNTFILLTIQKIAPMTIISYNMNKTFFIIIIIMSCMMISSILGINQISIRKILAYSSINHMGWMLSSLFLNYYLWMIYWMIYTMISLNIIYMLNNYNIFYMKQMFTLMTKNKLIQLMFSLNFLSLGGLPPFIGFFPKWITIQMMVKENFSVLSLFMIIMTLITLFYYIRLTFSIWMLSNNEMNLKLYNKNNSFMFMFFNMIMILSLFLITPTFSYF